MIAEYIIQDVSYPIRVIRSVDDGKSWETVMTKTGMGFEPREIRHFHTCKVDPYTDNWYVSSGDLPGECRIWMSTDNGDNWTEITDPNPVIPDRLNADYANSIHRYTDIWFTEDYMYWATDDRLQGLGSYLIRANKTNPINATSIGRVSYNHVRDAIDYGQLGHLLITENNSGYSGIELTVVTPQEEIIPIGIMEGTSGYFTSSYSGKFAVGDPLSGLISFARARIPFPNEEPKRKETWEYKIQRLFCVETESLPLYGGNINVVTQPDTFCGWRFGEKIDLSIIPNIGCEISGLYTNDELIWSPSERITNEFIYQITLNEDMKIKARFTLPYSADQDGNYSIELPELLRVIQLYKMGGYHCQPGTEDGYAGGYDGDKSCIPHASDYNPQDWKISLIELLRAIQFYNIGGYYPCEGTEDGFCPTVGDIKDKK